MKVTSTNSNIGGSAVDYRKLCKELVQALRQERESGRQIAEAAYETECSAIQRARRAAQEAEDQLARERLREDGRRREREIALGELKRAQEYGDQWAMDKARRRLQAAL